MLFVNPTTSQLEDATRAVNRLFDGRDLIPLEEISEFESEAQLEAEGYDLSQLKASFCFQGNALFIPEIVTEDFWVGGYWQALIQLIKTRLFEAAPETAAQISAISLGITA